MVREDLATVMNVAAIVGIDEGHENQLLYYDAKSADASHANLEPVSPEEGLLVHPRRLQSIVCATGP